MSKKNVIKVFTIIFVLTVNLILPLKGNTQINNNLKDKKAGIKNPKIKQKQTKKNIKKQKQLSSSTNLSAQIKALQNELLIIKSELEKKKKNEVKKDGEIKVLTSNSANLSTQIKALEKELLLVKTKFGEEKKARVKIDKEMNFLHNSLDKLDIELSVQANASEKYKELIDCYRAALFLWDDLNGRQGLTEQEHLVIRVELKHALFNCPAI
jgi:chromosome segregation ATPase